MALLLGGPRVPGLVFLAARPVFNSLIIKLLRQVGLFRSIPTRRAQSILLGTWATAMAFHLLERGSWIGEVASIWLVAVAMNLAAAAVLAFRHGASRPE